MITGKRGPVLTLPDDAARLKRYVKRFEEMQEKFRTGGRGRGTPKRI